MMGCLCLKKDANREWDLAFRLDLRLRWQETARVSVWKNKHREEDIISKNIHLPFLSGATLVNGNAFILRHVLIPSEIGGLLAL